MKCKIIQGDCERLLKEGKIDKFDLSFVDPPFNQNKEYRNYNDSLDAKEYWDWMKRVLDLMIKNTSEGGAVYFMQREKNTQYVLETLETTGWTFQNLIIWRKKTSAIPCPKRFGKHYQIIAFATKGNKLRVFNKLRINPPLLQTEKYKRPTGMFVTDVWDDIRELTSGYFAGDEPFRIKNGERFHKQQSPVHLLTRIILSSSKAGDMAFDPFAGTGTTLVVARQLMRNSVGIDIDPANVNLIKERIDKERKSDSITKYRKEYMFTEDLDNIWPLEINKEGNDKPHSKKTYAQETAK